MPARLFLLSPASCSGNRARLLFRGSSAFPLAERVRTTAGVPLGEVFAFISQLYFRGKLAYARAFARPPRAGGTPGTVEDGLDDGVFVITPSRGAVTWRLPVDLEALREFAAVEVGPANDAYTRPLEASVRSIAERLRPRDEIVLLGSIASDKYVRVLADVFGSRLRFPRDFVGRGDMSRGGLMLRCVQEGRELEYVRFAGSERHGTRPPRLGKPPARAMAAPPGCVDRR